MTKTHPERDFTERAISMLKAYDDLEDLSPISSYTHEKFGSFFIDFVRAKVESKQTIEPIDYLQIPFRIAQCHEDPDTRKLYTNYIEKFKDNYKNFKWKLDRLDSYSTIPSRIEKIYDDGDDLFENTSPIGKEFYFCYRLAQYAQICKEQGHPEYADCFCGIDTKKSNNLPEDLQKILESDVSVNSQDFWEKYKQYFSPQYMNFGEMDFFLKKFLMGISKTKPKKIALKEILLKARLFNIIWLPYNKIEEPDPEANEDFFLKVHILKNKGNIQSTNFADFIKKIIKTSNEKSFDGTLGFLGHKWSITLLLKFFTDIPHRKESISHHLSSGTGKKETLKENLDRISYTSSFPILDKIQYPLNKNSEPRWLYPLIQVLHNIIEHPDNIDFIALVLKLRDAANNGDVLNIEGNDPSKNLHIYLVVTAFAEFFSKGLKQVYNPNLKKEIPDLKSPKSLIFRFPNIISQIASHPKINALVTTGDIVSTIDIERLQKSLENLLKQFNEFSKNPTKFILAFMRILETQKKSPEMNLLRKSMSSILQDVMNKQPASSTTHKN